MNDYTDQNILAIDTSTRRLKLAIRFRGDRLVQSDEVVEHSHGKVIMRKIGNLLESASLSRRDIQALAVSVGPGSFTGLRIGLAVAKGMAVGLDIPVVGVSVFELAAYHFRNATAPVPVLVPFKRGEYFLGTVENGRCELSAVEVVTESELSQQLTSGRVAAVGFDLDRDMVPSGGGPRLEALQFDAAQLLYVGDGKLARGETDDLAALEPLYLRKSQAEIRFEQRRKSPGDGGEDPSHG